MAAPDAEAVFSFSTEAVAVGRDRAATSLIARFFFPDPKPARLIQATLSSIYGLVRTLTVIELGFNLHQLFFSTREAMHRGLPPVCFRCGRLGHNHGRCPTPDVPLNLEDRGPWMSLPAGVYRRVNEFTLQLEPSRRSSQQSADLHLLPPPARPRPAAAAASSLPPPMPPSRSGRDGLRSDASTGHRRPHPSAAGARSAGKRPQLASESARPPPGLPPSIAPASPESVGSSSASLPPGFHCGETSGMQMSWLKGSSLLLILLMPTLRWWIIVGLAITLPLESTGLPGLLGPSALGRNPSPGLLPPFLDFSPNSLIQLAGLGLWAESGAGVGLLVAGPLDSLPGPVVSSLPEAAGAVVACSDPQLVPVDGGVDVARPAPAL
ncbi:hypothetical protein LINGRAHAP2_LOCUS27037 [Linum grandiflorum]